MGGKWGLREVQGCTLHPPIGRCSQNTDPKMKSGFQMASAEVQAHLSARPVTGWSHPCSHQPKATQEKGRNISGAFAGRLGN